MFRPIMMPEASGVSKNGVIKIVQETPEDERHKE
jgi:hypothetical protein